jgi:hypothetical protein
MTGHTCFSYSAQVPLGVRNRDAAQWVLRDLPRRPKPCFSYSDGGPLSSGNRGAAQRVLRDLPSMPHSCFSYSSDVPLGSRPVTPGGTGSHCFRY